MERDRNSLNPGFKVSEQISQAYKFMMLTHASRLPLVHPGDRLTSVYRKHLKFAFLGVHYEYCVLPFGFYLRCTVGSIPSLRH